MAGVAERAGASSDLVEQAREANTASQVGELMAANGVNAFFDELCASRENALNEMKGGLSVATSLYTLKGEFLGKAETE